MKKNTKKVTIGPLDQEIEIKPFAQFPPVKENDELQAFTGKTNFGCTVLVSCVASVLFYFFVAEILLIFIFNLVILLGIFLWNYKYNFNKKAIIVVNKAGITHKNSCYQWNDIANILCAEEFDEDRRIHAGTYIKFNYKNSFERFYISSLSRPVEEILHYINAHQKRSISYQTANPEQFD